MHLENELALNTLAQGIIEDVEGVCEQETHQKSFKKFMVLKVEL